MLFFSWDELTLPDRESQSGIHILPPAVVSLKEAHEVWI